MGDQPSIADVMKLLTTLTTDMSKMQNDMATMQEKIGSSADSSARYDGQHPPDRPPRFQKMDFPRFDGKSDPLIFLNRCESYFRQQRTMPEEKVWMASYNLEDVAQLWFLQLQEDEGTPPWGRFKELLNLRFGPALRSAPLFELTECRRTGSVEDYSNRFQALLPRAGRLEESQRVQLYTGGLLPPLSHQVRVHAPETLAVAMSLARTLELVELDRINQLPPRAATRAVLPAPPPRPALPAGAAPPPQVLPVPALPAQPQQLALPAPPPRGAAGPSKRLSTEEQAERRRLGLCYNCNEPYSRGHNRVCRRIFYIDGIELEDAAPAAAEAAPAAPLFSLLAVAGMPICDSMQVRVTVGAVTLTALLDTGSTHNFIAEEAAARTGLTVQPSLRLTATVANGERIACPGVLRQAPIAIVGENFCVDLYVMPLAGYDVVLGTQWMVTLGKMVWDFTTRTVAFTRHGRTICWEDVAAQRTPRLSNITAPAALLEELLTAFGGLFAEPSGLPPPRARDHSIVLKPGALLVAVRPYRYPAAHKDELERQCAAMIEQGIVRRSDSAFSSPILLVKKPDGSWCFCVDYRALNALTVKDAFPIPVVDELLDELHGACFFTKLDLRSGYHQVRMRPADIHKTAFKTHDGLYEFLVMAFGLCNAPAMVQALMNDVLRPFLRRFVLVFFDDILIYSRTWADHLRHLRAVFGALQQHQLFVKRSKCAFAASSVAYLGHVGVGRRRRHGSDKGAGCAGLAAATIRASRARLPGTCRVLPEVRAQLRHHRRAAHRPAQEGRVRLVAGRDCCVHRAKGGGHLGTGSHHAGLLQDIHRRVRRVLARLRGGAGPGQPPGGLQPACGPPAPRSRGIRARTDRPRAGSALLEALPLGAAFRGQDRSLQPQVLAGSEAVHDPATPLGRETPRLRLHC